MKLLVYLKQFLHNLKFNFSKKKKNILISLKDYNKEAIQILKKNNFTNIKAYSLKTWKNYGKEKVRLTFIAKFNNEKYLVKLTKGFENKSNNALIFQTKFNDLFNFIPNGYEIIEPGWKILVTKFIKPKSLNFLSDIEINNIANQALNILDMLNKYKIVHCDIVAANLIVSQKNELFIIDWDTLCSPVLNLYSDAFPDCTIKIIKDNCNIYDDAYSFFVLFQKLNVKDDLLKEFENRIGRNSYCEQL